MADLDHQIGSLTHKEPCSFISTRTSNLVLVLQSGLLAELRHRNVPFVVDERFLIRTLGDNRRFTGHNENEVVRVATGSAQRRAPGCTQDRPLPGTEPSGTAPARHIAGPDHHLHRSEQTEAQPSGRGEPHPTGKRGGPCHPKPPSPQAQGTPGSVTRSAQALRRKVPRPRPAVDVRALSATRSCKPRRTNARSPSSLRHSADPESSR